MAIFPRYEGQSVNVPTPETPAPPALTRQGEMLAKAGGALAQAGIQMSEAVRKRQILKDDTLVTERFMQASKEIEEHEELLKQGGAGAEEAREQAEKLLKGRQPEWYRDLNPEAAFKLETKLFGRTLEYRTTAGRVATRALLDHYNAGAIAAERELSRAIAKGLVVGTDENGKPIPGSIEGSHQYKNYLTLLNTGVITGATTKEKAETEQQRVLANAALDMGHSMVADRPEALLAMPKQSGFLANLTGSQEAQLRAQAETAKRTKERDAEHKEDRQRDAIARFENEQREYFEADFERSLRGDPGAPAPSIKQLDDLNNLRLLSGEKYKFYRDAIENRLVEGDPSKVDPALIRELGLTVGTVSTNPDIRATESRVMQAIRDQKMPFKQGMAWLQSLQQKRTQEDAPPTMRQQLTDAKSLVKSALTVEGPLSDRFKAMTQPIETEALEDLDRLAAQGFPESPLQYYFRKKSEWQGRAQVPAIHRTNDLRRALGLQPMGTMKDDLAQERAKLQQKMKTLDPSSPAANAVRQRAIRLRELMDVEAQLGTWGKPGGAQSGGVAQPTQQQPATQQGGSTPPVPKPRVPGAR